MARQATKLPSAEMETLDSANRKLREDGVEHARVLHMTLNTAEKEIVSSLFLDLYFLDLIVTFCFR